MKIIYEVNLEKDKKTKLYACESAQAMLMAIDDIAKQLREWYKYDTRAKIPKKEVISTIREIIKEAVDTSKLYEIGDNNESNV